MRTHAQTYQHNKHINGPFLASHSLACAFTLTLSFFPSLPHKYQLTQIQNDDCCFICCFNVLLYFTFFSSLSLYLSFFLWPSHTFFLTRFLSLSLFLSRSLTRSLSLFKLSAYFVSLVPQHFLAKQTSWFHASYTFSLRWILLNFRTNNSS